MDILRHDFINSLPQPLYAHLYGGSKWPIYDIEVETALMRIDVVGRLEIKQFSEAKMIEDADGIRHESDIFYSDYLLDFGQ